MVEDLPAVLEEMGGCPTVVVTSWSYSYLQSDDREQFQAILAAEGRRRPVAWVFADAVGVVDLFRPGVDPAPGELAPSVLGLAVFSGGRIEAAPLAFVQPHGGWVEWLDPEPPCRGVGCKGNGVSRLLACPL
jgi:hypothetical protein